MREEAGIDMVGVKKVGELEFTFEGESTLMHVMVYSANSFTGTLTETEGTVCL